MQKSATVAEFNDCHRCLAVFGDSRRFLRQSHFSATVAIFGDSVDRALQGNPDQQRFTIRSANFVQATQLIIKTFFYDR